jgi:4a-hydroxytetrahydrobiopterin dehydratase
MDQVVPPGWTLQDRALVRTVQRADFVEALGFILAVARPAEAADHHPDIDLRYNKVHLSLSTHSAGHQVTAKDYRLAREINDLGEDLIQSLTDDLRRRLGA